LGELEEFCVKSSPCYYSGGLWHHYEPETSTDPWGPTGAAIGAAGLIAAIAVPLTDRLVDWIIYKYSSQKSRWAKIDTMETTLNSIQSGNHNHLMLIDSKVDGINITTTSLQRELSNGLEETKAVLENYEEGVNSYGSQLKEILSEVSELTKNTKKINKKISKRFEEPKSERNDLQENKDK
jgi:hypothetical protein